MNQGDFLSSTWVCVSDQEALMGLPVVLYYFWRAESAGRIARETEWGRGLSGSSHWRRVYAILLCLTCPLTEMLYCSVAEMFCAGLQ